MAKLLHISPNEYPELEVEHATKQIWKELSKDYEEYHILGRADDQRFHTEKEGNIYLHRIPKLNGNRSFLFTSFIMLYLLKKYKIDVMLAQCALLGGIAGVLYGKILKIPIMVEIHDILYFHYLDSKRIKDWFPAKALRWVYSNAQKVRALNPYMEEMLKARQVKGNICIIQNRVNLQLFEPKKENYRIENEIRLISIGTFVKRKGHVLLIEIVKELTEELPIRLILAGGGELTDEYKKITQGYDNFEFYGKLPQHQLTELLRKADIYVHPAYREAVPRAIIEAMAMGLPIITSDAGMVSGLIEQNKNGLIFPAGNKNALKEAIITLANNMPLRENLGNTAYANAVTYYEWGRNFEHYRKILKEMQYEYKAKQE